MARETVRDKIVNTALGLFYKEGYNQTGIDKVIEDADIARGSLYYHFESKTDLLLSCMDVYQQRWYEELEEMLRPISDARKKLLTLFDYRIISQERRGYGGCLFIKVNDETGNTDARILKKVQENKDKLKDFLRGLVNQLEINPLWSRDELVHLIYCLLEGSLTSASIYKSTAEMKKAQKILSKMI